MNTRHAQLILTVLREGSFTAAAKALYITQPTLSQTVRQIETQLGEPIFVRGRTPLQLTAAGELYTQAARRILQIESQLTEAIDMLRGSTKGAIHMGFSPIRSDELLPQVLPAYAEAYPDVQLFTVEAPAARLEQMLLRAELDMALLSSDHHLPQLTYRQVASEEIVLLAGQRSRLAQRIPSGSTIQLSEAADERFVLPREGTGMMHPFDTLLAQSGVSPRVALRCDNMHTAKRVCVLCGHVMLAPYITYLCDSAAMKQLSHYHLASSPYLPPFYIVHNRENTLAPHVEALITLLTNRFRMMTAYRE